MSCKNSKCHTSSSTPLPRYPSTPILLILYTLAISHPLIAENSQFIIEHSALTPPASPPYSHPDVTAAWHRTPSRAATPRVSLARQSHPFPPRKSDAPAAPYS